MVQINVITGFLGAGKTTLIKHLLTQKPAAERWGVLVNEFGDVGIDGALLGSGSAEVVVKEVPGGCLCCANGLPFQIALNQLLGKQALDRLLIEPTGLGHPLEILTLLAQPHYQQVSNLAPTLTLVDARKLSDKRYTEHALFNQQIQVADRVLAAKADAYQGDELAQLQGYCSVQPALIEPVFSGIGQVSWLQGKAQAWRQWAGDVQRPMAEITAQPLLSLAPSYNARGFVYKHKYADGFHAYGWAFAPELCFSAAKLEHLFTGIACERLKAVVITESDILGFNFADGVLSVSALDDCIDSRVEIIAQAPLAFAALESQLLAALTS